MHAGFRSVLAGAAGATALTGIHQLARAMTSRAPRMDVLGMRAIERVRHKLDPNAPLERYDTRQRQALAGDLLANSAYYSLVAVGDPAGAWTRGAGLGLAAGLGALYLPQRMGLGTPPHSHDTANQIMTVAWYLIGGLAAASVVSRFGSRRTDGRRPPRTRATD
jgi:hypothetical protein